MIDAKAIRERATLLAQYDAPLANEILMLLDDRAELLSTCRTLGNLIRDLLPLIPTETIQVAGLQKRVLAANEKAYKANQKAGQR